MGTGFSIDTPVKVAPFGISSSISLADDSLIEKMREFYCQKFNMPFQPISVKIEDFRAKRITEYLNLIDQLVKEKFEEVKKSFQEKGNEFTKYLEMLPDFSGMKREISQFIEGSKQYKESFSKSINNLFQGAIDVNIMTKLDKENYKRGEKLPAEHNDAHAALRGFANSSLNSSVIFSAGMNPHLYSYIENFKDFYPDKNDYLKKKIILKVSDFRSALIQGKFLAKKGIWISEYRVESGLNCGGHAFATEGNLMGPILEEFKNSRKELINTVHSVYVKALEEKGRYFPSKPLEVKITAQGGVGNAEEH